MWYKCYHSTKYPVTTFVHVDNEPASLNESNVLTSFREIPNANSTMVGGSDIGQALLSSRYTSTSQQASQEPGDYDSRNVGSASHIPRVPPSPATYTIPSITNIANDIETTHEALFGMIKLRDNDVCYTSGTIEWVGRKRSFPINSGFKILNEDYRKHNTEPVHKKTKNIDKTFQSGNDVLKECDCADVLPTVNAIVDHLNALHEAVDLVDLRLNTLEDVMSQND